MGSKKKESLQISGDFGTTQTMTDQPNMRQILLSDEAEQVHFNDLDDRDRLLEEYYRRKLLIKGLTAWIQLNKYLY